MLKQRILTASILAPIVLCGVFLLPLEAFAVFMGVVTLLGAWEWGPLSGIRLPALRLAYVMVVLLSLILCWGLFGAGVELYLLLPALLLWCISFVWVLRYPAVGGWSSSVARLAIGVLVLAAAWLSLLKLKSLESGNAWLLLVLLIVWAADIGAYFSGKRWGKVKLAPNVSPGKTREGVYGGLVAVVGQMQHDLFHIYTVDAHTMKVIQKMRQFRHSDHREQFPIAHRVVNQLPKIELLYIAGLYHDIAKGRGGDHSELGAEDVLHFCEQHHLGKWDSHLVAWLVRNHLLMSMTAQRKDISDPEVIHNFAMQVRDIIHLDYLYVLTVADINATNHTLWNSWRATLLRQLYMETKRALRRGLENPVHKEDRIEQQQSEAMFLLKRHGISEEEVLEFWNMLGEDYFLREDAQNIAWHTRSILEHAHNELPLVLIQKTSYRVYEGATEIFIYSHDLPNLFSATVATLDQLHLNIQDARIIVTDDGRTLNTYTVLTENNEPLSENPTYLNSIRERLIEELDDPDDYPDIIHRRVPRQMKLFAMPTTVSLSNDPNTQLTVMEVRSPDRPGLLARIGQIFAELNICVRKAKIASVGERVEDFFFLTDADGLPISDPALCEALQTRVCRELDEHIRDE